MEKIHSSFQEQKNYGVLTINFLLFCYFSAHIEFIYSFFYLTIIISLNLVFMMYFLKTKLNQLLP